MIASPEDATPEWLSGVLRESRLEQLPEILDVRILLTRKLAYSTVARLKVEYSDSHGTLDAPVHMFLKLSRETRSDSHTRGIGEKEVEFCRNLAPEMSCPPLIRCYDAAFSAETGRSYILLDDLFETHSQPEQNNAPSESFSHSAVEALAKAHAHWWNDPRLGVGVGMLIDDSTLGDFIADLHSSAKRFIEDSGSELTSGQKHAFKLMLAHADRIWGRLKDRRGLTVTHGDAHWWNFLYPNNLEEDAVRVFDWHLWHVDLGARDLAFLLALGGFTEPRPEIETGLLRTYHDSLTATGVSDYSWEQLVEDYRWSAIRNLNIPVIFWSQGKHESTWQTALRRAFESYERLKCEELL